MLISVLIVLIVPKMIGVDQYGYFQLYLFYASYVGILHFGWNDGIYLKYGGAEYNKLDKRLFFSQFWMLFLLESIISLIVFLFSPFITHDINKVFILKIISLCLLFTNMRDMILYILQSTNRIKEYVQITIIGRVFYFCITVLFLIMGNFSFKYIIIGELFGRFISLGYAIYKCKDIVFLKISLFYFSFKEALENMSIGIKLMFSNFASMLIIGVVRFGIERAWDVDTFGKVSLTLSISNFLMLFITAVGIILYPILRRTEDQKLSNIYFTMRNFIMILLLGFLIVCYPLKSILYLWLPKYADSLKYMTLVFPMVLFAGKMELLINTYLKTLRKEKAMLKINLVVLFFSILLTSINVIVLKNLILTIVSIVILLSLRCIIAEIYLSSILNISIYKDIFLELIMTSIFIFTGWFINSWIAVLLYCLSYLLYLLIKRKDIVDTVQIMKILIKN